MGKERRTVSLDPAIDAYLAQDAVNASALVNQLVETYQAEGGSTNGLLELRKQQLESEIHELKTRLTTKEDELEHVTTQLEDAHDHTTTILEDASNVLDPDVRDPENPAVKHWARKADLPVPEFLDRLTDQDESAEDASHGGYDA